ncbi:Transposase DDE domain-containing protein [Rhizobiales bacterium GAS188]|nr:Transposase DDE domain-containing protein [Rhizobiales bacterium GAS188]
MQDDSVFSFEGDWPAVEGLLGGASKLDALARETGALVRRRRICNGSQLLRLALGYAATGQSLRSAAAWSHSALGIPLSDVAVLQRLRDCGDLLSSVVGRLLSLSTEWAEPSALWRGPPIRLVDGSMFAGPGKRGGQHRLHASYDPGTGRFDLLNLTDVKVGETLSLARIEPGTIAVADRNYAKTKALRELADNMAFFLVRAGISAMKMIYDKTGERLTAQDVIAALGEAEAVEIAVTLQEAKPKKDQANPRPLSKPLKTRIVIVRASEAVAARERARIERSRSKHGVTPREDTKAMAGLIMFATNLLAEDWPIERLIPLYRLRWQIELAFKVLKSIFAMRAVPAKDPALARTWILANLAAALLANLLASALERAIPPSNHRRRLSKPLQNPAPRPVPHSHRRPSTG